MEKCLYDQWFDGQQPSLNTFTVLIFNALQAASGDNKAKLIKAWPEWFADSKYI